MAHLIRDLSVTKDEITEWFQSPVTSLFFSALRDREELLVRAIVNGSGFEKTDEKNRGALLQCRDTLAFDVDFLVNELEEAKNAD